jgi:TolA-binding protein
VGALPLVDPPAGLELSILEAEQRARSRLPLQQRIGRGVSVLAGYAMRPQLAMAALLLLAIGSSLIFFRARPGDRNSMSVTERGVPEVDSDLVAVVPATGRDRAADAHGPPAAQALAEKKEAPAAAPPRAGGGSPAPEAEPGESPGDSAFQSALGALKEGRNQEAREQFESVAARGGADAAQAAFHAAEAAKNELGCSEAAKLFDQVPFQYPGTRAGYEATFQAASCYEALGDVEKARRSYQALLDEPSYGDRARSALAQLERAADSIEVATRRGTSVSGAAAKAAAPAAAQSPASPPPQQAPAKPVSAPPKSKNATGDAR